MPLSSPSAPSKAPTKQNEVGGRPVVVLSLASARKNLLREKERKCKEKLTSRKTETGGGEGGRGRGGD